MPSLRLRPARAAGAVLTVVVLWALAGCALQSAERDYEVAASEAAGGVASSLSVLVVTANVALEGQAWSAVTDQAVTDAEGALTSQAQAFNALTPPTDDAQQLREVVSERLGRASDLAARLRIHLAHGERGAVREDVTAIEELVAELDDLALEYR